MPSHAARDAGPAPGTERPPAAPADADLRDVVRDGLVVMVIDSHAIFRTGLAACLAAGGGIAAVHEVRDPVEALGHPALRACDVVLMESDHAHGHDAVRAIGAATTARLVVCSSRSDQEDVLGSVQAGAVGYLSKQSLTPQALGDAVRATASGGGVVAPELLAGLLDDLARVSRDVLAPRGLSFSRLAEREQQVLRLVADGRSTREVAIELSYSERTVKNILHDVVTKLDAKTRSQAVAHAVRQGLI